MPPGGRVEVVTGFERIEYLHWIHGRPEAATHDLGSSDLRGEGPLQEGIVPEALAGLPDPDPETDLSELLAAVYGVAPENVLPTAGAMLANVVAAGTTLSAAPEDEADVESDGLGSGPRVLVEKPGYEPLIATPQSLGAEVDRFLRPAEEDYALDPDRVGGAATGETVLVSVTNRHNPSGALSDRETLAAAAERAGEEEARLLVDEVYAPYTTDPTEGAFGGVTAAGIDDAVVTSSLTKFFGLGGLRIGWIVADTGFVDRARDVLAHVPTRAEPSVALARRALYNREDLARRSRELLAKNADHLATFVADRPDVTGPVYGDNTYAFLEYDGADGDAVAAAAEKRDLLVVPGRFFDDPDRFRVSLGRDPDHVEAALSVLDEVLEDL
jgi:aspartate/methionine/tyrosine aminotransferase